jgi:8-oxo-dGTP pyrophosphatase MutT (NUDIX family)
MAGTVTPIDAASVIVVRDDPFEVLMLQRHEASSFVPQAWVFPGGIVEASDRRLAAERYGEYSDAAIRLAAVRETFEESGIWLGAPLSDPAGARHLLQRSPDAFGDLAARAAVDLARLTPASRWITPKGLPRRFDTWFFIAVVSRDLTASVDESETTDLAWISPEQALSRSAAGEMKMVFPTLRNLESIRSFRSSAELVESRRGTTIEPIEPILVDGRPTLP